MLGNYSYFTLMVAIRYILSKKNDKFVSIISIISFLGITIGVAALIVVMSVMNGFHVELTRNIIGLNGDITISPYEKDVQNYDEIYPKLAKHSEIKRITPLIVGQALAIGNNTNSGLIVKGLDAKDLRYKGKILDNLIMGSFYEYSGTNVVALGVEAARILGVRTGDSITLITPNLISTAFGSVPRSKDFKIIAIFSSGMFDYDSATILMPIAAAQKFLSVDNYNLIEINTNNPENADKVINDLHHIELVKDLYITSWKNQNQQFLKALEVERAAMFAILLLIIIVAAFNIIASLFMIVKDKTKDIAILRTIGASRRQITSIFVISGMMVGMIGTILGVGIGLLISCNVENIRKFLEQLSGTQIFDPAIYFLYNLPSHVNLYDVLIIAIISLILCLLATIYPAYRASTLNPVEVIRYE